MKNMDSEINLRNTNLDIISIQERFELIESRLGLDKPGLRVYMAWPICRFEIIEKIFSYCTILQSSQPITALTASQVLALRIKRFIRVSWPTSFRIMRSDALIVPHPRHDGSAILDESAQPLTGWLFRHLARRDVVVCRRNYGSQSLNHNAASHARNIRMEFYELLALVVMGIPAFLGRFRFNLCAAVESEVASYFGVRIDVAAICRRSIRRNRAWVFVWTWILLRVRPKTVFVPVSYGNYQLIRSAHKLKCKVAEIQHGMISPLHHGYRGLKSNDKSSPDFFLSFGAIWSSIAETVLPTQTKVINLGTTFGCLESIPAAEKNTLLVISQGAVEEALIETSIQIKKNNPGLNVEFRVHPGQDRSRIETRLCNSGITISPSRESICMNLRRAGWVLGVYSTALLQAADMGIPCFVLDLPGSEHLRPWVKHASLYFVRETEEMRFQENYQIPIKNRIFEPMTLKKENDAMKEMFPEYVKISF